MVARGKRSPSAEMIIGIYLNYGSYIEWLITGQGPVCRQTATVNDSALDAAHGIDPKTSEFLRMTHDVLASGTIYAKALEQNIMAFHRAMMHDKLQAYDEDTIEERLRKIEYRLKLIDGGADKQVEQPGDATRKEGIATELMPEGPKLGRGREAVGSGRRPGQGRCAILTEARRRRSRRCGAKLRSAPIASCPSSRAFSSVRT